jgi:hypothetical protein
MRVHKTQTCRRRKKKRTTKIEFATMEEATEALLAPKYQSALWDIMYSHTDQFPSSLNRAWRKGEHKWGGDDVPDEVYELVDDVLDTVWQHIHGCLNGLEIY